MEDIWEALEATTNGRKQQRGLIGDPANAQRIDILNHRDELMRFLTELDGELSVAELREALEEYR